MFLFEKGNWRGNAPFARPFIVQLSVISFVVTVVTAGAFPKIIAVRAIPRCTKKINIKSFERGAGRGFLEKFSPCDNSQSISETL